ncbi:MAG: hypothetical protein QM756_20835 [Polyangiaceae bacterium]
MLRSFELSLLGVALALAALSWPSTSLAQSKPQKARPAKVVKAPVAAKAKKAAPKAEAEPEKAEAPAPEAAPPAKGDGDAKPRAAGTTQADSAAPKASVKEKEGPEGVKTYQFGAIEVEGRQKSPQLIYFLRRVRAEFDAGALGHRSFLGELDDSRNDTAFR